MSKNKQSGFDIVDRMTNIVVGHAKTQRGARRSVDRRDNVYGAYRFAYRSADRRGLGLAF